MSTLKNTNYPSFPIKLSIMFNKLNNTEPQSFSCLLSYSFSDFIPSGFITLSVLLPLDMKIPQEPLLPRHCVPWQPHQILALPITSSDILSTLINLFKPSFLNCELSLQTRKLSYLQTLISVHNTHLHLAQLLQIQHKLSPSLKQMLLVSQLDYSTIRLLPSPKTQNLKGISPLLLASHLHSARLL